MKRILYILGCFITLAMASCSPDSLYDNIVIGQNDGNGITFTLSFPEMENVETRAFADSPESLRDLDVFLFVFDGENLLQIIHIPTDYDGRTNDDGKIKFTALLPQTENNAVVHIVAIDDNSGEFAAQIDTNGYGVEDIVIPALTVSGDKDAYWQRVDVGCPIKVGIDNSDNDLDDVKGTDEEVKKVFGKTIHLIRNFAKVTLKSMASNFNVLAWTIVNERDAGSVAPWFSKTGSTDIQYARYFLNEGDTEIEADYERLTADGYIGVSQSGASLRNTVDEIGEYDSDKWIHVEGDNAIPTKKYIYERRNTSVNPLYLLIYGELIGASGSKEPGYYKLALGHTDHETGIFTTYNVLRNIAYHVTIDAVTGKGTSTPAEAAAGPASNNISGDVVTSNLTQISDGVDRLEVSFINYVVTTEGHSVDFRFRYTQNFTSDAKINNQVVFFEDENIGIKTGDVISSYTYDKEDGKIKTDDDGWATIHIKFNKPLEVLKQQTFTLYSKPDYDEVDGSLPATNTVGLSRTINFVLREPWDFIRMETYAGNWADDDQFPDWDNEMSGDNNKLVGPNKGDKLTVFFELPAGLPQAVFPLECTFESDRQNIENDGKGSAVVKTGPSLFSGVLDHRISYTKIVNWQDYAPDGESSTARSRIQRARFITTTNISSLEDANYITTIRLHNPYFNDKDDKFERDQSQSVNPPKNSVRTIVTTTVDTETTTEFQVVWDLSDSNWNAVATSILTDNTDHPIAGKDASGLTLAQKKVTTNSITTIKTQIIKTVGGVETSNETKTETIPETFEDLEYVTYNLTIDNDNANAARKFKVGTDADGSRYFYTNYGSNLFSLSAVSISDQNDLVSSQLEITAAPADGGSVTPKFSLAGLTSLVVNNTGQSFSGNAKQTNTYPITAGSRNNDNRTITITPAGNNANQQIKFYRFVLTEKYYSHPAPKVTTTEQTVNSD